MPIENKKTKILDLGSIIDGLIKSDIKFILVGGLATVIQGAPITTMDVDIVHKRSLKNIEKLLKFLKSINAFYRRPDNKILKPKKSDFSGLGHALFNTQLGH